MKLRSKLSSVQRGERLGGGREAELDPVVDAGLGPGGAGDIGPFAADVAARHPSVGRHGEGHGRRAVAGEGADLEDPSSADQLDQQRHEGALVGSDLHVVLGQGRRALTESRKNGVLAHAVRVDVGDDVVGEVDGSG